MPSKKTEAGQEAWDGVFAGIAGLWLALALIKFGNPVILEQQIQPPGSREEFLIYPWPVGWGYGLLVVVVLAGYRSWRWHATVPKWLLVAPLVWLGWQFVSATQTVDRVLTTATLKHFVACVASFYVGLLALARVKRLGPFWLGLIGGFLAVLILGWKQHLGGLEETRRYFYSLPDWQSYPPEFLQKISSNRIYSTLVYPNALAGTILLLLPIALVTQWPITGRSPSSLKICAMVTIGILGLAPLYWSGSKSGWLIAVSQMSLALAWSPLQKRTKAVILVAAISGCLSLFWVKNQDYFHRGASSMNARFDYWQAAAHTLASKPLFGAGPGTFMISYKSMKRPETEMTRLAHNDYLQQGSDSGWTGLLAYTAWIAGSIWVLLRNCCGNLRGFGVPLGLLGLSVQGLVEFGLYVPALAWPFFTLLGLALGNVSTRNQIDKQPTAS